MEETSLEVNAFLADSVTTAEGKIYAHGVGWNLLMATVLPVQHSRIGVGILIRVPWTSTNQSHEMQLRLEDADGCALPLTDKPEGEPGEKAYKVGTNFNVGRPPYLAPGEDQIVPMSINIDGLRFEKAERYRFVISIDGTDVKNLPLRVVAQPQPRPILT